MSELIQIPYIENQDERERAAYRVASNRRFETSLREHPEYWDTESREYLEGELQVDVLDLLIRCERGEIDECKEIEAL